MRITLIGAGFSGCALAIELLRRAPESIELCLVGQPGTYGRGVAYGDARPEHLLNVRAGDLGLAADAPGGFADWLHLAGAAREGFLPRLAFGDYLRAGLHDAAAASAVPLHRIEQEAVAVARTLDGFRVHLVDGSDFRSDAVVLAVGALPPTPLAGIGPRLAADPGYVALPWQDGALDRIAGDADVLVVGTGLTMVDVVATLQARGHRGRIAAVSRHGLLPQTHLETPLPPIALPPALRSAIHARDLRALVRAVRQLSPVVADWRQVVDALRPHLQQLWSGLPPRERARVLRHLRSHWEAARHRVAPEMAQLLHDAIEDGSLTVRAARVVRATRNGGRIEALLRPRGAEHLIAERYDALVRATGLDTDIDRTIHPLIANLRESGLLRADPHGLGVDVDARFRPVDADGTPVAGLYVLGPLLRGLLWEITAVRELREAAAKLAADLCGRYPAQVGTAVPASASPLQRQRW